MNGDRRRGVLGAFKEEFPSDLRIRIGVAAGAMYSGHLGYAQFKAMVWCSCNDPSPQEVVE